MSAPRRRRRSLILAGVGVALVGTGGRRRPQRHPERRRRLREASGDTARRPDVAVALEGGGRRSLASFRGHPVVIGFVQPYCTTCITTLKTLDAVARAHPDGSVIRAGVKKPSGKRHARAPDRLAASCVFDRPGHCPSGLTGK